MRGDNACISDDLIDLEIKTLEKLVAAEKRKLQLLEASRKKSLKGERLALDRANSRSFEGELKKFGEYLVPRNEIKTNYSVMEVQLMSFKVKERIRNNKKASANMSPKIDAISLLAAIDVNGILHIYDASSNGAILGSVQEELASMDLGHNGSISVLGYEGSDAAFPIIASAATDGSVHMTCLEILKDGYLITGSRGFSTSNIRQKTNLTLPVSPNGISVVAAVCSTYNINDIKMIRSPVAEKTTSNHSSELKSVKQDENSTRTPFVTSLVLTSRGASMASHHIYAGDSNGFLHNHNAKGEYVSSAAVYDQKPLVDMVRIGAYMVVAARNILQIVNLNTMTVVSTCSGAKEPIVQVALDLTTPSNVIVKLASGMHCSLNYYRTSTKCCWPCFYPVRPF